MEFGIFDICSVVVVVVVAVVVVVVVFRCVCLLCFAFWYTPVVSNVFLRVSKTESDFQCTEKTELLVLFFRFVLLLLALLLTL